MQTMRCLGLLGGGDDGSVAVYERRIVAEIAHRFGIGHSANRVSLNLAHAALSAAIKERDWPAAGRLIRRGMEALGGLGAEAVVVCSNLLHPALERFESPLPVLSIADAVVPAVRVARKKQVGVIGTVCDGEERFWRRQFAAAGTHAVFFPLPADRGHCAGVIAIERSQHILNESSRDDLARIVYGLRQAGAKALVVVAPGLAELLDSSESILPIFDAADLHASAAVDWAIQRLPRPEAGRPRKIAIESRDTTSLAR